jgi:predicted nucleic acid-binding Zn ribbon protein
MALAPVDHEGRHEGSDPAELLIKEARRKARRRRLSVVLVLLAAVLVVVVLLVAVGASRTNPKKTTSGDLAKTVTSASPTCLRSQLRVVIVGGGAGLGHGASLIQVTNASGKDCSLTGYPKFTGIFASGVQRIFKDTLNGYIGGLGTDPLSKATPPVVTLRAHHGVASSMEEADANGIWPHTTCPGFTSYVVSLPHVTGGTYTFHPRFPDLYCFQAEVHPFVPGATGSVK